MNLVVQRDPSECSACSRLVRAFVVVEFFDRCEEVATLRLCIQCTQEAAALTARFYAEGKPPT